ncbi:disease resistance protein RFL1 [Citrus clementina]|nr:disease resistance protein RFL1 [Citrus x clementina]
MCSIFQITCDGAFFNRCLDCFLGKAAYIRNLQDNLDALDTELENLIAKKNDVMRRVVDAERQQMRRLDGVQRWVSRVEVVKTGADELMRHSSQEIDKLCVGGYCSKNCRSIYKFGKQVAKKLQDVKTLIGEGVFEAVATEVVAERAPEPVADKRPTEPTIVGLQSQLEQVWRCLVEESVGIIGLYGMGGVGKTTLLTHINNKFLESPTNFDCVIWVVVSKDLRLEKIQEDIGKKIGLSDDSWKNKSFDEKAVDIQRRLGEKRFVLLLDDLWERVDLTEVGVPLPSAQNTTSKVVFTTRSIGVCGSMRARPVKVACLSEKQAWELFRENVGEETLESDHEIVELAQTVAKECGGLPLALITIGRAMAYRKKAEQWRRAIEELRRSTSEFAGLGKEVYPLLKFSYDSLQNDTIRSCFLYCCLYSEDYGILKWDLIDCWIGEGFLGESDRFGAENQGYDILDTLVRACLLEEVEDDKVKMHDVIRDMALWITCEIEKEKRNFLVCAGAGLKEAPDVKRWENVRRLSLMQNQIELFYPSYHALQILLSSNRLKSCIRSLFLPLAGDATSIIDATAFADLNHLNELGIDRAEELEELKIDYAEIVRKRREPFVFRSLHLVAIYECHKLKDLTFLVFAPSLKSLSLYGCNAMEEIISVGKFDETPEVMGHISPFGNLQTLDLSRLPILKSIYWKPLPFTHLKEMAVTHGCNQLRKLPLDSNSAKERKFVIRGREDWWNRLQWEDEATQIAFRSCFQPHSW